ncbi:N-acetyltransferase [Candidatus Micrarchaeota archaeon]|nr:N-acetyltransferase [Candidatus Micrarchaeota archaeon]
MMGKNVVIYPGTVIGRNVTIFDNAVLGRPPKSAGNTSRKPNEHLPPLEIGDNSVIGASAVLYCGTRIGRNVLIGDLASIREECEVGDFSVIGRGTMVNYQARIGQRVKIMDACIITGNMVVEDDAFIGMHAVSTNDAYMGKSPEHAKALAGPHVCAGAAVGANATLLAGVRIGKGAIVGAGSVVTHDVPEQMVAMGVPAKVIRKTNTEGF